MTGTDVRDRKSTLSRFPRLELQHACYEICCVLERTAAKAMDLGGGVFFRDGLSEAKEVGEMYR